MIYNQIAQLARKMDTLEITYANGKPLGSSWCNLHQFSAASSIWCKLVKTSSF